MMSMSDTDIITVFIVKNFSIHSIYITKNGVVPAGTLEETNIHTLSTCKTYGGGCTAWVIAKGNMDYLRKDVSW